MTAILEIVQQNLDLETRTNVDWLDGWAMQGDPVAEALAFAGNTGNGTISPVDTYPPALAAAYTVEISEVVGLVTYFALRDADGGSLQRGIVGATFQGNGLEFTLTQGATPFAVGDGFTIAVINQTLDLTGISFRLTVRKNSGLAGVIRNDVALTVLSTETGDPDANGNSLHNTGEDGIVAARIPASRMAAIKPGLYDYDLVAIADDYTSLVAYGTITHTAGIS